MNRVSYYQKKMLDGIEKVLVDTREELAIDLKACIIDQATFEECDLEVERAINVIRSDRQVLEGV